MIAKPIFLVCSLMLLSFVKNFGIFGQRNMSLNAGTYSAAYVTVPTIDVAKKIARGLVENHLAACVNIIPQITSVYEWQNEIKEDDELLLMIKTRTTTMDSLTKFVKEIHPYEVCEVISFPIENGNDEYLDWIGKIVPVVPGKPKVTTGKD